MGRWAAPAKWFDIRPSLRRPRAAVLGAASRLDRALGRRLAREGGGLRPDALAVTRSGDLQIIEIKDCMSDRGSGASAAPPQLARYVRRWRWLLEQPGSVFADLRQLVTQKKRVRLLPASCPEPKEDPQVTGMLVVRADRSSIGPVRRQRFGVVSAASNILLPDHPLDHFTVLRMAASVRLTRGPGGGLP